MERIFANNKLMGIIAVLTLVAAGYVAWTTWKANKAVEVAE